MRISNEFSCCIDGENRLEIVASCLQSNAVLYILDKRVPMVKIELSASCKIFINMYKALCFTISFDEFKISSIFFLYYAINQDLQECCNKQHFVAPSLLLIWKAHKLE